MALDPMTSSMFCLLLMLTSVKVASVSGTPQDGQSLNLPAVFSSKMHAIQERLHEVTNELLRLDQELEKALFCQGGNNGPCQALFKMSGDPAWQSQMVSSEDGQSDVSKRLFNNLQEKRSLVQRLHRTFTGANDELKTERKRSCRFNLGFHCRTEDVASFADMYDYLSSPESPGKKRSVRSPRYVRFLGKKPSIH